MEEQNDIKWTVDPGHSNIQFKVKHVGIASVAGNFLKFEGAATTRGEDFENAAISLTIDTESVTTNNTLRDEHLRGEMFFDVVNFSTINFSGTLRKTENAYLLFGKLTIRDITKDIQLNAAFTGTGKGKWDEIRAGFELCGKINRKDFGINLELLTATGSLVVGEHVYLNIDAELIKG